MYYIYLAFILILSGLMFLECKRKGLPKWWSAIVLAAPITTPYFIVKSRKGKSVVPILIFLVCLSFVTAGEIFIYSHMEEKLKYANLPPLTRQLIRYSEILKTTTQNLDKDLFKLELQSKLQSNVNKLELTIEFVNELRQAIYDNQAAIKQMVDFVENNSRFFTKTNLQWVYEIKSFYNNRIVIVHFESLENYLDAFENLLRFCYLNFDAITKAESRTHLKNYDEYYLRYRRAVDSHNRLNLKRIQFQNKFVKRYPEIQEYLPAKRHAKRHTDALRFWE